MDTQQIAQVLQYGELQAFGLGMPRLAPDWSTGGSGNPFTVNDDGSSTSSPIMTITSSAHWAAPFDATYLDIAAGSTLPVTLLQADGTAEAAPGALLTLPDQAWLRLGRLYCEILESSDSTRPERNQGLSARPVPRYIYFPANSISASSPPVAETMGLAEAGADLGFSGDARFYDADGLLIDPIAVMAAFAAILTRYPGLQAFPLGSEPVDPLPLDNYLTGDSSPLASDTVTRVRLVTPSGAPYKPDTLHLTGLTSVDDDSALNEISGSPAIIGLDDVDDTFTQYDHDRLVFCPSTSGRLTSSFTALDVPSGSPAVTLARDYYTIRVVELQPYLTGTWPDATADPAVQIQRYAPIRINENISFHLDGNDLLGAVHSALDSGSPTKSTSSPPESDLTLAVAQAIDGSFPIPALSGTASQWSSFPRGITVNPGATLPINLSSQVTLAASWQTTDTSNPEIGNVVLEIANLPPSAWVRVYPGQFQPNADMTRGDGQGREVSASGAVVMVLPDPFLLRAGLGLELSDQVVLPPNATLQFDMAVNLPNGNTRIYGGLSTSVGKSLITSPPLSVDSGSNPCGTASYQGVSNAGVLGLGRIGKVSPAPTGFVQWANALSGQGPPRDAPRLPTMARRELLVAGAGTDAASGSPAFARTWSGVIAGGRIQPETICAQSRIGAPGSFGGRETTVIGASTHGGILAYDIARHALRRSQDIIPRLVTLASSEWNIPAEPDAVDLGQQPAADNGTMAGALLQTVAPYCESPELYGLWDVSGISSALKTWITDNTPDSSSVLSALSTLQTTPAPPQPAIDPDPGSGTVGKVETTAQRLAIELERELTGVLYGRRDTQWSLHSAIQSARNIIYIETPGFCSTAHNASSPAAGYTADLIATLTTQMAKMPGLYVIVCVPKNPDFAPGYEGMASYEVEDRLAIVNGMKLALSSPPAAERFALFHPIGFPGRNARVETNVVIIDDIWALIGGSTFRRRGLTFDGSSDLVFTDTLLENSRSTAIRDFRRTLMANRLGIQANSTESTYVALKDASTAFGIIQSALAGGGLGKLSSIWDGTTPGLTPATPLTADQANPDGREFDMLTASIVSLLGSVSGV
jgi:hypothetical protein